MVATYPCRKKLTATYGVILLHSLSYKNQNAECFGYQKKPQHYCSLLTVKENMSDCSSPYKAWLCITYYCLKHPKIFLYTVSNKCK